MADLPAHAELQIADARAQVLADMRQFMRTGAISFHAPSWIFVAVFLCFFNSECAVRHIASDQNVKSVKKTTDSKSEITKQLSLYEYDVWHVSCFDLC
jgi:hypothetical protein